MENKSISINYSKKNIVINLYLSSNILQIDTTYLTIYANTFKLDNTINYNDVYYFIGSKNNNNK